jgi:hypothetical protein
MVQLVVAARRFRCDAVLCGRRVFTERFVEGIPSRKFCLPEGCATEMTETPRSNSLRVTYAWSPK